MIPHRLHETTQTPLSPRLSFRRLQNGDEMFLFPAINEKLTEHWIDWEPPRDINETRQNIELSIEPGWIGKRVEFLAFALDSGEFVGSCSLTPNDYHELEMGYWVKVEQQQKGYGYEIVQAFLYWMQNVLCAPDYDQVQQRSPKSGESCHISQVIYSVTTGNAASEAIIRKLSEPPYLATHLRISVHNKRGKKREVKDYSIPLNKYPLRPSWL